MRYGKDSISALCIHGGGIRGFVFATQLLSTLGIDVTKRDSAKGLSLHGVSAGALSFLHMALVHLVRQTGCGDDDIPAAIARVVDDIYTCCLNKSVLTVLDNEQGHMITVTELDEFIRSALNREFGVDDVFVNVLRLTFADVARMGGSESLSVYATDDTTMKPVVFSTDATPDVSFYRACLASGSVPVVFEPQTIDGQRYSDGYVSDFCSLVGEQRDMLHVFSGVYSWPGPPTTGLPLIDTAVRYLYHATVTTLHKSVQSFSCSFLDKDCAALDITGSFTDTLMLNRAREFARYLLRPDSLIDDPPPTWSRHASI